MNRLTLDLFLFLHHIDQLCARNAFYIRILFLYFYYLINVLFLVQIWQLYKENTGLN